MNRARRTDAEARRPRTEVDEARETRYVARVADAKGAERYELVIAGPRAAIEKTFGEAELDVTIDPDADKSQWERELRPAFEQEQRARSEFAAFENVPELFKKKQPTAATAARSIFVSVRPLEPGGTRYSFTARNFFVPRFFNLFFGLPPVCSTFGVLTPLSGDQDLFLHLGWPPLGPVRASVLGGTATDVVTLAVFCTPWTHFGPIFQVFGFTSGVCSRFTFGGTDIFG